MNADVTRVLEDALKLPPEGRAALASLLLDSLDTAADPDAESAWKAELDRRARELQTGEFATIPWSEARRSILDS